LVKGAIKANRAKFENLLDYLFLNASNLDLGLALIPVTT
jgi:hypothetical protein